MNTPNQPPRVKEEVTVSDAACEVLCQLAGNDPDLWVFTGDVWTTARLQPFATQFPGRFMNVGIAEQCMVGVAAGMATCGKLPIVAAFASMLSMRACEQIRTDVAYNNLNVKFLASAAGFAAGHAGPTHHATEDMAMLRSMGNMTVIVPCDAQETRKAVREALAVSGPVYIRLGGRSNDYTVYDESLDYRIGRANVLADGSDVTLIGCGRAVIECIVAREHLSAIGIQARVIDMHTVKPIDAGVVAQACAQTGMLFTVEDHNSLGGLGGGVAEVMADIGAGVRLKRIGVPDTYAPVGSQESLIHHFGLDGKQVADTVVHTLKRTARSASAVRD